MTVTFERYFATGFPNRWNDKLAQNFKAIFVKSSDVGAEGAFSFELLKIDLSQFDCIVVSSYSSPAEILLLIKLKVTHTPYNIINLSDTENLVTVMTCNEIFDPERPDTFGEPV